MGAQLEVFAEEPGTPQFPRFDERTARILVRGDPRTSRNPRTCHFLIELDLEEEDV